MSRRRGPRELSEEERRAWAHLASTVTPMAGRKRPDTPKAPVAPPPSPPQKQPRRMKQPRVQRPVAPPPAPVLAESGGGLDRGWDKKLTRGTVEPDFTLDLHGHGLDAAYRRLDAGLSQAIAQGARVLLVVAGKPRPVHAADRAERRGAIRAKLLDWIAAGPHASRIAAVRGAHPRHGGRGALYLILRRPR
ncbi:Smr/MutS family protein [Croceicoccus mobilis]|uniref:Smr protein/Muts2-like n=1 Tax=Croceicoccus mobilis TaxID=1703339 RepID=A0A916YT96_9SPHN|nr:Smr/MutS family protein [Croceicoccus mobilis]GGD59090.1 smr protein/Muts2-like [Croceicoccus mobilis]